MFPSDSNQVKIQANGFEAPNVFFTASHVFNVFNYQDEARLTNY